jgi:hypothetical protein
MIELLLLLRYIAGLLPPHPHPNFFPHITGLLLMESTALAAAGSSAAQQKEELGTPLFTHNTHNTHGSKARSGKHVFFSLSER